MMQTTPHLSHAFWYLIAILPVLVMAASCQSGTHEDDGTQPDPRIVLPDETTRLKEALELVNSDQAVLLDVRELNEWNVAHFAKAKHLATTTLQDPAARSTALADLPKDKPVFCHCKMGGRALACTELLAGMGYDVRALAMPYTKLVEVGFQEAGKGVTAK